MKKFLVAVSKVFASPLRFGSPNTPGTQSDFKIYDDQYYSGQWEIVDQVIAAFNAASAGAIQLTSEGIVGTYEKASFVQRIPGLITRRNLSSVAQVNDIIMQMEEFINVKINRKVGPVAQTLDAWKKIGATPDEFSFALGKQVAEDKLKDQINTIIMALAAALQNQATNYYDATGQSTKTLTHNHLVNTMAKMGDASSSIVAWVMHSKPYHDLMGQAITDKIFGVANATIYAGNVATFNRPTVVIDAPGLFIPGNSQADTYLTLGLVQGAAGVKESEPESTILLPVTGYEQLFYRLQGEFSYNIGCRGFRWNTGMGGGANPTDAALATGSNWIKAATSHKHLGGAVLLTR